ncbi:membrane protein of unknown function [Candidatus Hydrogenisulfobacillus filiaventi]|uniref:Uncharacterized protein n=1 Tax=Candidatus Hydrogenisulfobacillus filiaventi TaxID=2707344 RepID=A0A6F8ZIA3_9FIRM|nr:membrane protein of unknown function [Candidatus Hydrogenisulfobacillus filiaventi]
MGLGGLASQTAVVLSGTGPPLPPARRGGRGPDSGHVGHPAQRDAVGGRSQRRPADGPLPVPAGTGGGTVAGDRAAGVGGAGPHPRPERPPARRGLPVQAAGAGLTVLVGAGAAAARVGPAGAGRALPALLAGAFQALGTLVSGHWGGVAVLVGLEGTLLLAGVLLAVPVPGLTLVRPWWWPGRGRGGGGKSSPRPATPSGCKGCGHWRRPTCAAAGARRPGGSTACSWWWRRGARRPWPSVPAS